MKTLAVFTTLLCLSATAVAQQPVPSDARPIPVAQSDASQLFADPEPGWGLRNGLSGNHNFPNFIGFMSNPLQNIDPRAVTELWPVFGSAWTSSIPALPRTDVQLYAAGLYLALSERLSIGLNQGGYAVANVSGDRPGLFVDRNGRVRDRGEFAGDREGWLNLGGFVQYTVIENVEDQFLLTAGLRWEAPSGSEAIFQGHGPVHLAPYLTAGQELGQFHVLATVGYQFPCGSGDATTNLFYGNLHLDRQFGRVYPLVELNWIYHTTSVDLDLPIRRGFFDFNNFESSGNILTLAVGANLVLIPERLEFGAVYSTPLATQRDFDFNALLVKMVLRY